MKTLAVVLTALLMLPVGARAEEAPASDVPRAVHLLPGAPAPFDGILLNRVAMEVSGQALTDAKKAAADALTEVAISKEELRLWKAQNTSGGVPVGTVVGIVIVVGVVAAAAGVIAGVVVSVQAAK